MPLPLRIQGLTAKDEGGSYAVDAAPTAGANAVRLASYLWSALIPDYVWKNRRGDTHSGTMLEIAPASARGRFGALDLLWEIRGVTGPYTAGVFVDAHPLIQCCGWWGTFSAAPTPQWTYVIDGVTRPSSTIYVYAAQQLWKLTGCRGQLTITYRPGQLAVARFRVNGLIAPDPTDTATPAFTWNAIIPPAAVSMALAVGAWSPDWLEVEIDGGNPVERLDSGNAADGIQSFDFGAASPTLRVVAKAPALAIYSPFVADQKTPTSRAFTAQLGTVQYNKMLATDALAAVIGYTPQDQNRFAGMQVQYLLTAPALLFN